MLSKKQVGSYHAPFIVGYLRGSRRVQPIRFCHITEQKWHSNAVMGMGVYCTLNNKSNLPDLRAGANTVFYYCEIERGYSTVASAPACHAGDVSSILITRSKLINYGN